MKNLSLDKNANILIRGVDTVGTFVLATPFYRELKKNFPNARTTLCVKPLVKELAKNCPYIDEIILYDKELFGGELGFIKELRKRKFDAVFILSGSFHSALMCYLTGIKNRIGYPHDHRGFLLTHKINETEKKHCVEYLLDILGSVGGKIENNEPELWFSEAELSRGKTLLEKHSISGNDKIIGIGFGVAGERAREWDIGNWIKLIEFFVNRGYKIILFGTKNDIDDAAKIVSAVGSEAVTNLAGKTNLVEFAGMAKTCNAYISVDTGGIHIAAAMGVPVVGLYVPGSDVRWGPRGKNVTVISKNAPCAPCDQHKMRHCRDNICMKSITVNEVYEKVSRLV